MSPYIGKFFSRFLSKILNFQKCKWYEAIAWVYLRTSICPQLMTFSNFWIWHAVKRSVVEGKCYFYYSIQAFTSNHCHFLESKNFDCPKMSPNRGKSLFILEQQAFACNNWLFKNVTKCSQMLAHTDLIPADRLPWMTRSSNQPAVPLLPAPWPISLRCR